MKKYRILAILPLILLHFSFSEAQQLRLSLIGAVSKSTGPGSELFNWGFSAGGDLFFYLDNNLLLGLRAAYSRWTPDDTRFTESIDQLLEGTVQGNASIIEIIPSLRLSTDFAMSSVNFYVQGGAGAFIFNDEITVEGTSSTGSRVSQTIGTGTILRFGFDVGAGLSLGNPQNIVVDLYPLFNFIFLSEDDYLRYFTINIAIGIGI